VVFTMTKNFHDSNVVKNMFSRTSVFVMVEDIES